MLRCMGAWRCMAALTQGGAAAMQESGQRLTPEEVDRAEMMHKYTLNNAHYFCETADVTRPFPSRRPVSSPSWEFVWNRWLAASLRSQGLAEHCPQLLQVSPAPPLVQCAGPACMRLSIAWCAARVHISNATGQRSLLADAAPHCPEAPRAMCILGAESYGKTVLL